MLELRELDPICILVVNFNNIIKILNNEIDKEKKSELFQVKWQEAHILTPSFGGAGYSTFRN